MWLRECEKSKFNMTSDSPLVSIVVTSYNYAHYIGQTIGSVLAQTYDNWELIVSDDGSTDNSIEVIRSFTDPRITLITSETNRGGAVAYAEAYKLCHGKYFTSLDSDDYIVPTKLEKQVKYLEEHPDVNILSTLVHEVDASGQIVGDEGLHQMWFNQEIDLNRPDSWLWQNHLCHSSALIRKAFHDRVGVTNPRLPYTADYEFWVRCLIAGGHFHVLPEKLTYYRAHGGNVTHKNPDRSLVEIAYIQTQLKPYLMKINRSDLFYKTIYLVHEQCEKRGIDKNLRANIFEQLLLAADGADNFERFQEKLWSPARVEALVIGGVVDSFSEKVQSLTSHATERGIHISDLENHLGNVEAHAQSLQQGLADKEAHISKMGNHIGNLETHIGNVQAHASNLEQVVADKETHIGNLETHISNVQAHASNLEQVVADKETHIGNLENHISNVQAHTRNLQQAFSGQGNTYWESGDPRE